MPSLKTMIETRVKDGERIVSLARRHTEEIAERLNEAGGHGMTHTQVREIIEAQARQLEAVNRSLASVYEAFDEGATDAEASVHLNHEAATELERVLWHAQGRIAEPFGPEMLKLYGLEESPPAGYRALATYAHNAVTLLRAHPQTLEGQFGDHLETEKIAETIEGPLNALNDYLSTLDDAPAPLKSALQRRDHAADNWMRVWRGVSTVLEGIFLLAERGDLAARVRPRLPGVTVEVDTSALNDINEADIHRTSEM